jgi:hypothetical protein
VDKLGVTAGRSVRGAAEVLDPARTIRSSITISACRSIYPVLFIATASYRDQIHAVGRMDPSTSPAAETEKSRTAT